MERTSRKRFGREKAQDIQADARISLGVAALGPAARLEIRALLQQIGLLEEQVAQTDAAVASLLEQIDQQLTTIPGLGPVLAATILGGIRGQLDPDEEPDHVEVWLDALEAGVFHLDPRTSKLAGLAIRGYGQLFLIWVGLSFEAGLLSFRGPGRLSKQVYEERERAEHDRQRDGLAHLKTALQMFRNLFMEEFADALLKEEWAAQHRENLVEVGRIWREMKELGASIAAECWDRLWGEMPKSTFSIERQPTAAQPKAAEHA